MKAVRLSNCTSVLQVDYAGKRNIYPGSCNLLGKQIFTNDLYDTVSSLLLTGGETLGVGEHAD